RRLQGRSHRVISGVALVAEDGTVRAEEAVTDVTFRPLDDAEIEWYLGSREWEGRAGGYAIQGRGGALVERIDGDYLNVVGLPVVTLLRLCPGLLGIGPRSRDVRLRPRAANAGPGAASPRPERAFAGHFAPRDG